MNKIYFKKLFSYIPFLADEFIYIGDRGNRCPICNKKAKGGVIKGNGEKRLRSRFESGEWMCLPCSNRRMEQLWRISFL